LLLSYFRLSKNFLCFPYDRAFLSKRTAKLQPFFVSPNLFEKFCDFFFSASANDVPLSQKGRQYKMFKKNEPCYQELRVQNYILF